MSPAPDPAGRFAAPETSGTAITLRALTTPDHLDTLTPGEGLGAYGRYRAGETLAMLRRVLRAPQGRLLAGVAGDRLVGYLPSSSRGRKSGGDSRRSPAWWSWVRWRWTAPGAGGGWPGSCFRLRSPEGRWTTPS